MNLNTAIIDNNQLITTPNAYGYFYSAVGWTALIYNIISEKLETETSKITDQN